MNNVQGEGFGIRAEALQKLTDSEIDHLVWRIAQLAILLFVLALAYRFISPRLGKVKAG